MNDLHGSLHQLHKEIVNAVQDSDLKFKVITYNKYDPYYHQDRRVQQNIDSYKEAVDVLRQECQADNIIGYIEVDLESMVDSKLLDLEHYLGIRY